MRWSMASLFARSQSVAKKRVPHRNALRLETLEDRLTPAGFFLTGVGGFTNPAEPNLRIYDSTNPVGGSQSFLIPPGDIGAFPGFSGSVRVATGDINGDGIGDFITAQGDGAGSGSRIRIFDGNSALFNGTAVEISSFFAYSDAAGASQNPGFGGGVFVASTDLNGDGVDELITSAGAGARGHVKVFNFNVGGVFQGSTPELRSSFFAYTDFAGEIRVTTAFFGGNAFLVTGSGAGTSQSDVRFYLNAFNIGQVPDLNFVAPIAQLFPFAGFNGGVSVAAGDTDGDGNDELFVSQNAGGSGLVRVYDVNNLTTPKSEFTAFGGFTGEVRLGAADVDGDGRDEVLTSTGSSPGAGGAHVKAWSVPVSTATELRSFFAYEGYINGVWLSTNDYNWGQGFTNTTPINLTDGTPDFSISNLLVDPRTGVDSLLRPTSISVVLNIPNLSGAANDDIDVFLQHPNGTQLELFTDVNTDGDGFLITLTDTAASILSAATSSPGVVLTGTFRPENGGSLIGTFGTFSTAGTWQLLIRDEFGADTYQLTSWGIAFTF